MTDKDRQLLDDIERYFDCLLSDEEEMELRRRVAATGLRHPAVDEAVAVMGLRRKVRRLNFRPVLAACSVAACLAVIVSVGMSLHRSTPAAMDSSCIAYVNGRVVTDEEAVMLLAEGSLREVGSCGESFREDLSEDMEGIVSAIDRFEMDGDPFEDM